jgi:hypothetical protein
VSVKAAHGVPWEHGKVGVLCLLVSEGVHFPLVLCSGVLPGSTSTLFRAMGTAVLFSQVLKGVIMPGSVSRLSVSLLREPRGLTA